MIILLKFLQWVFRLVFLLPPSLAVYLMHFAAEVTCQIVRFTPLKKMVSKNIRLIFPREDATLLAEKLLRNVSYSIFELLCVPFMHDSHLNKICRINGLENLDLALSKRKGVLLLSMHTGNYELIPVFLASLGYKTNSILKAPDDPLFKLLNRSRSCQGVKLINVLKEDMYHKSIQALGNNEIVGIMVDTGALESRNEMTDFLGHKVPAAVGWLTLAQRCEAAILPIISKREGKKIVVTLAEPMTVFGDNRQEIIEAVKSFFENFIKNHPEQWAIFLNSFETKRMVEGK